MIRFTLGHMIVAVGALLTSEASFAYVDPGTGSLLIQWIFGMVVASFAVVNLYWHRFKQFLSGKTMRRESSSAEESAKESGPE